MVRPIRDDDLAALLQLYTHLHEDDLPLRADDPEVHHVWRTIRGNPHLQYFVAEKDDQIVSTCSLTLIPNLTRDLRPYGLIENVVTHPAYRKQGLASAVLDCALNQAWMAGCYKVMLLSGRKDEGTLSFYEKAGFQRGVKTGFIAYPQQ